MESDELLMERIREGRPESLQLLLDRYWEPLVAYAAGILQARDDAQDIVQETFVRVWNQRAGWQSSGSLAAYLYRITRNLSLNAQRDRLTRERNEVLGGTESFRVRRPRTPEQDFENEVLRRELDDAIAALPERRRETFILSRFHGLSHAEIAEALGVSPQTVSNQMSKALADLRDALRHRLSAD